MPIRTIEVICLPCSKCLGLEQRIRSLVETIGIVNKIKIPFEFIHTKKLTSISQYALNPSQTPAILINGQVEIAGKPDFNLLRRKLEAAQRSC